ncbi:hypothetical protein GIS00_08005 [Nakamurella sp. YIM 132087]|uniref:Uncharacterized protein n=1 Tax=Nakamurella alba TaxID=2665158 RepID=A0A7K1FLW8_9ACTN|nr:hypothetical protein [Nakamurella alba]MTD13884.1 hypothetical protein [Nakamurella alba]
MTEDEFRIREGSNFGPPQPYGSPENPMDRPHTGVPFAPGQAPSMEFVPAPSAQRSPGTLRFVLVGLLVILVALVVLLLVLI